MPDDMNDQLLALQTRARMAHDLAVMLVSFRTEDGWRADALVDECLDRLQHQLALLTRSVDAMRYDTCARSAQSEEDVAVASVLNAHR